MRSSTLSIILSSLFVSGLGLRGVAAQNSSASVVDVEGVRANFEQAAIVPELIPTSRFNPEGVLNVAFSGNNIQIGQALDQSAVSSQPDLAIAPEANATSVFSSDAVFTVLMTDADVVGTDEATTNQTFHWLVNNVKVESGSGSYQMNYTTAPITNYGGPAPASGSGPHRYCLLVIEQPSSYMAPSFLSQPDTPIGHWNFTDYLTSTGLGNVVAASYFTVEVGTASASISSTSAVVSSTLAGFGASATSSGTSMMSMSTGSASASAKASGSNTSGSAASASATSSKSGALAAATMAKGLSVMGVLGAVFVFTF